MKVRNTLILLIVLSILGGFIWFKERHGNTYQQRSDADEKIYDFTPTNVVELVILNAEGAIVAKKEKDQWSIVEPLETKADQFEIDTIIQSLNSINFQRKIKFSDINPDTLDKEYHLKKPTHILSWSTPDQRYSLRLGADTPMGNGLFVQKEENADVYIIPQYARETLARDLSHLRDRSIFPFQAKSVQQVDIRSLSPTNLYQIQFTFTNNIPRITKPIDARAATDKVTDLTLFLTDARAMDFIAEGSADLKNYGLSEPDMEVSIRSSESDKPQTLLIGQPVPNTPQKYYAKLKDSNSVITITAELFKELTKPLAEYRDKHLIDRYSNELNSLVIQSGSKKVVLLKKDNEWKIDDAEGSPADTAIIIQLLDTLMKSQISQYVSDAPESLKTFGLEPALHSLSLNANTDNAPTNSPATIRFDFGKTDKGGVYVKRSDEIFIYRVNPDIINFLNPDPSFYLNHIAVSIEPDTITGLEVIKNGKSYAIVSKDPTSQSWLLAGNNQGVISNERLSTLLSAVQNLRAISVNKYTNLPKDLLNPALELIISLNDGKKIKLSFGKQDKKLGRPMTVEGQKYIYYIDESIFQLIEKELTTTKT
ncbi:MAG: DUF4340 domain-containing protein [Verrucomicrobiota bacterium]|nr:DUF4340 domain-containing protein [Verrucomicrobiota bacterium]